MYRDYKNCIFTKAGSKKYNSNVNLLLYNGNNSYNTEHLFMSLKYYQPDNSRLCMQHLWPLSDNTLVTSVLVLYTFLQQESGRV